MRAYDGATQESMWSTVTKYFIVFVVGSCLGFGASEKLAVDSLSKTVIVNSGRLDRLWERIDLEQKDRTDGDKARQIVDEESVKLLVNRVDKIADMLARVIDQNNQLITLLKVQNSLR